MNKSTSVFNINDINIASNTNFTFHVYRSTD